MVDFIKEKIRAAQELMSPDSSSGPQITDEAHVQAGIGWEEGTRRAATDQNFRGTGLKPWRTIKSPCISDHFGY